MTDTQTHTLTDKPSVEVKNIMPFGITMRTIVLIIGNEGFFYKKPSPFYSVDENQFFSVLFTKNT